MARASLHFLRGKPDKTFMDKQDINILVVEDDAQIGGAVHNALLRAGFRSHHVKTPQEALAYVKIQEVHGMYVDCMLPRMNGVDLAIQLKSSIQDSLGIILASGIFKDRQFMSQAKDKTGADIFLKKPFDITEVSNFFERKFQKKSPKIELSLLLEALANKEQKPRKKIKAINDSETFHCFDLPWILCLLNEAKASGHINIKTTDDSIAGIEIFEGRISRVDLKNEKSYIGMLLVEKGFVTEDELGSCLQDKTTSLPIGQWLVKMNIISPHAIDQIIDEQITIRLNKLITDSNMEANFTPTTSVPSNTLMSDRAFLENLVAWTKRTRPDWLKKFYLPLMNNRISEGSGGLDRFAHFDLPIFQDKKIKDVFVDRSLEKILEENPGQEDDILQTFHLLTASRGLKIDDKVIRSEFSTKINRLKTLNIDLEGQNYFERLGLSKSAKATDIKKVFHDLAKALHPDKVPSEAPPELKQVAQSVFNKVQQAYETLVDSDKRTEYLRHLQEGAAEKIIQAENLLEEARTHLLKGAFSKVLEILKEAEALNPESSDLILMKIWVRIKKNPSKASSGQLSEWKKQIQSTPPEHRKSALYFHVKGLVFVASEEWDKARNCFEQALTYNQAFISSKRELTTLVDKLKGQRVDLLNADLRDVVGMLFRKK